MTVPLMRMTGTVMLRIVRPSQGWLPVLKTTTNRAAMNLTFAEEDFVLLADRAILWPRRRALLVADTHFGKDSLFQQRGIPVPTDVTAHDLSRLGGLVDVTEVRELIVLGDFFHGRESNDAEMTAQLKSWRDARPHVTVTLLRGNHDRHARDPDASLGIECLDSLTVDAVKLQHHPIDDDDDATNDADVSILCGHVHPATTLADFDGTVVKLPCFVVDERQLILPAFGRFTGTATIERRAGRQLLIAAHGRVLKSPR